jgi:hypothetical protein
MAMARAKAMKDRKIPTTVYLTPEQDMALRTLTQRTKVPLTELVRRGVDLLLESHGFTVRHKNEPKPVEERKGQ